MSYTRRVAGIVWNAVVSVGPARFELATSCSQSKRATKLRHGPCRGSYKDRPPRHPRHTRPIRSIHDEGRSKGPPGRRPHAGIDRRAGRCPCHHHGRLVCRSRGGTWQGFARHAEEAPAGRQRRVRGGPLGVPPLDDGSSLAGRNRHVLGRRQQVEAARTCELRPSSHPTLLGMGTGTPRPQSHLLHAPPPSRRRRRGGSDRMVAGASRRRRTCRQDLLEGGRHRPQGQDPPARCLHTPHRPLDLDAPPHPWMDRRAFDLTHPTKTYRLISPAGR